MSIIYAVSNAQAAVQSGIDSASDGDTIIVPGGYTTWGAGGSYLNIWKDVTVQGTGDLCVIVATDAPAGTAGTIRLYAPGTVANMCISGNPGHTVFEGDADWFRVTQVNYAPVGAGSTYFCRANYYGLIDNCNITGGTGNNELIFIYGRSDSWQTPSSCGSTGNNFFIEDCHFDGQGYVCDSNGNSRTVVRNCTVGGNIKVDGHGIASNSPYRGVRHMEVYNNTWTWSGGASLFMELRGGGGYVFNNQSINQTYANSRFLLKEYGAIQNVWSPFGVSITGLATGISGYLTTATPHNLPNSPTGTMIYVSCSTSSPKLAGPVAAQRIDSTGMYINVTITGAGTQGFITNYQTPYNYPIIDQIGVGQDPRAAGSMPMYIWNNATAPFVNAGYANQDWQILDTTIPTDAFTLYNQQMGTTGLTYSMLSGIINANRDYFKHTIGATFDGTSGVGYGTVAQMMAITPTLTGVGFWATDTGRWNLNSTTTNGAFFTWNGTGWALNYMPATYPHPMRGVKQIHYARLGPRLKLRGLAR